MNARPEPRPDVREGGEWTRSQSAKNDAIVLVVRIALALVVPLPRALLRGIGLALGALALVVFGRARRTAHANVALAFPDLPRASRRAIVRRAYVTLGGHLGDALAALEPHRALEPLAVDDDAIAMLTPLPTRGVLFASAHLGPWERVAATLIARGVPLTALARESYDARLDVLYERLRGARGVGVIYRGLPGAASRIVRVLRAGGVLGVPMDLRSRVPSIDAPFLDRLAPTPVGPARIALRTGAAVVVGSVAPAPGAPGGELRITCTAIDTRDLAADAAGERLLTERINAELSRRIRALPTEWVWMHDRFPFPSLGGRIP